MNLRSFDIFKLFSETLAVKDRQYLNRDVSWLAFNHRVLQEARDVRNPLYERLKFLAIYSSNLDEFFRVRVSSLRSLQRIKKKTKKKYDIDPVTLIDEINRIVKRQQEEYGDTFRYYLLKEMRNCKVYLVNEKEVKGTHDQFLNDLFKEQILPHITIHSVSKPDSDLFLQNKQLYLAVALKKKEDPAGQREYAIVELPTAAVPRFITLPSVDEKISVMFLDDIVRKHMSYIFPQYEVGNAYCIKLTRDAELYFEDEFAGDTVEIIKKAVKTRKTGAPSRFLFDATMPTELQSILRKSLKLTDKEMIPGARYHNFSDFMSFPNPDRRLPEHDPFPPLDHITMTEFPSIFTAIREKDWMLHFPYHSYEPVIRLLEEAAVDPNVGQIRITLYRVAASSRIISALITAAKNKKLVTVYVELMARFDEESNIFWAEELKNAGARVLYGLPKLKVHAKLCLITRTEGTVKRRYGYLSTGNFNERTATVYTDHGLFTSDIRITKEMFEVFKYLNHKSRSVKTHHLLVAPFSLRERLLEMIRNEITNVRQGIPGSIFLKANSIEDREMIDALYEASRSGVTVTLLIRGICCLIAGEKKFSKNITAVSIVGRFLEHDRIYHFHNGGNDLIYLSSADWMRRNLNRRVEVAFPVFDVGLKKEIKEMISLQLMDTVKARIVDKNLKNNYKRSEVNKPAESQTEIYHYLKIKCSSQLD
jgi:polyphosphate kinase